MISMDLWIFIAALSAGVIAGFLAGVISTRLQKQDIKRMLDYDMRKEYIDYENDENYGD